MSDQDTSAAVLDDISNQSEELERIIREWLGRWQDGPVESLQAVEGELLQRLVSSCTLRQRFPTNCCRVLLRLFSNAIGQTRRIDDLCRPSIAPYFFRDLDCPRRSTGRKPLRSLRSMISRSRPRQTITSQSFHPMQVSLPDVLVAIPPDNRCNTSNQSEYPKQLCHLLLLKPSPTGVSALRVPAHNIWPLANPAPGPLRRTFLRPHSKAIPQCRLLLYKPPLWTQSPLLLEGVYRISHQSEAQRLSRLPQRSRYPRRRHTSLPVTTHQRTVSRTRHPTK